MLFRNKKIVTVLDHNVKTEEIPTIKTAKLVYIQGRGTLTSSSCSTEDSSFGMRYLEQMELNGIPLIQINSPGCPTCNSLLSTGYGIEHANCQELKDIQTSINDVFVSLDVSMEAATPLLGLLKTGLYIIADAECYPTDGNGKFFWDTPNTATENPATAGVLLPDADYAYVSGQPIYLYPTQDTDCYREDRVNYYMELFQKTDHAPRTLVYCFSEFVSFILDGHHKACAAAALKRPVNSILIIPFSGYGYKTVKGKAVPDSLFFSALNVPFSMIPGKYLQNTPKRRKNAHPFQITSGTINHRIWETRYIENADYYPSVFEYAHMKAAGVLNSFPIEEEEISNCMKNLNEKTEATMFAIILALEKQRDSRLKRVAMECARIAPPGELKKQAYKSLAQIKTDSEIEQFFIDYLVECQDKHDLISPIIDAYWE